MENIINTLDRFFVNGCIDGVLTIIVSAIVLLIINKPLNKLVEYRWPENNILEKRIKKIILWIIFISIVCTEIKVLKSFSTAILASGGIVAVVIGLASQQAASSLINGFMILTYKPFKVGDLITIKNQSVTGTVIDITLRHTIIETLDKTQIIIPNSITNNAIIENITQIGDVKNNFLYIDIAYESDVDQAIEIIQRLAIRHPLYVDGRTSKDEIQIPVVVFDLKDSAIQLRALITTHNHSDGLKLLADLRKDIIKTFKEEGVSIPYPHIHVIK